MNNQEENKSLPKIGVLIYTHNRVDDALINKEIIRNVWKKSEILKDVKIVHSFNGKKEWYSEKYLEDDLINFENYGHFSGAEVLINGGVERFKEKYPDTDYVIILAADTWCVMPEYIEKVILGMQAGNKYMATCAWGTKEKSNMFDIGMAIDFNIFDFKWAAEYGVFPIRFSEYVEKYSEIFYYKNETIFPERVLALRFKQAIIKSINIPSENLLKKIALEHIYHQKEREPIHIFEKKLFKKPVQERRMYYKNIGLLTHHEPQPKQKALKEWDLKLGKFGERFLEAGDLSYYNNGLVKVAYVKNGKKIDYND